MLLLQRQCFYTACVDPWKVERQVCNNLYVTSCLISSLVVHTWADRNLWVAPSLRGWLAFILDSCRDLILVEHKTLHLEGGRGGGKKERRITEMNIICKKEKKKKKENTIRLLCKWAAVKTTLPIIALIISFLCEFAYFISILFIMGDGASILMWLKKKTHTHMKQRRRWGMGGRKRRGARWPPHIEYFPVDFVEGFSAAAWLNKQRHANEWRTSVII